MNKLLSQRNAIGLIILIVAILLGAYIETRPKVSSGQESLTDIQNIETLRAQFNQDIGKTRLILIASPT